MKCVLHITYEFLLHFYLAFTVKDIFIKTQFAVIIRHFLLLLQSKRFV